MPTERQRRRREKLLRQAVHAPAAVAPAPAHVVDAVRKAVEYAIDDEIAEEHAALAAYVAASPTPRPRRRARSEWLTVGEAAELLGVARSTLYRRARAGTLTLERGPYIHTLKMSRDELRRVRRLAPNLGGRPVTLVADVRARITRMRTDGMSLGTIAAQLNAEQVPTAQGGARWWASTVRAVLQRAAD